jgi:FkbM family methyltransferase
MTTQIIDGAERKSWAVRFHAAQFLLRQTLAKLSYAPVPVHLQISETERLDLWWSYIVPYYEPTRGFFDYWGQDLPELQFLWETLKPGMVFFDIGAYHGIFSLVAGRRLGRSGRVVAFEPSPREFSRLKLHLRWNHIEDARAEPLAVGSDAGERTFFQVSSGDKTRNGLRPPATNDSLTEISVSTVSLDQYIANLPLNRVDVVKLDVEGGEMEALSGAASLLNRFRPMVICEVLDGATQPWGYAAREIITKFLGHDFVWFDFRRGGFLSPHTALEKYTAVRNYLAVPREKLTKVAERITS